MGARTERPKVLSHFDSIGFSALSGTEWINRTLSDVLDPGQNLSHQLLHHRCNFRLGKQQKLN